MQVKNTRTHTLKHAQNPKISSNRHKLYGLLVNKTYQSSIIGNSPPHTFYTSKFLSLNPCNINPSSLIVLSFSRNIQLLITINYCLWIVTRVFCTFSFSFLGFIYIRVFRTSFVRTLMTSDGRNPPIHMKQRSAGVFHIPETRWKTSDLAITVFRLMIWS